MMPETGLVVNIKIATEFSAYTIDHYIPFSNEEIIVENSHLPRRNSIFQFVWIER